MDRLSEYVWDETHVSIVGNGRVKNVRCHEVYNSKCKHKIETGSEVPVCPVEEQFLHLQAGQHGQRENAYSFG